ncbi:caspase recruitment domain-containing protein 19-like isoform 2-T2 [Polymixia lowei]
MTDIDGYLEQVQRDALFLCSDQRMDTELVDRLVLQLNRIYPQILNDKEAHRFRNLSVPTKVRLEELLKHLQRKGEEACHEFYRGLHIHAEDVYFSLPTRVKRREMAEPKWTNTVAARRERYALNNRECETLRGTGPFLHCSVAGLGSGAKDALISYTEVGNKKK